MATKNAWPVDGCIMQIIQEFVNTPWIHIACHTQKTTICGKPYLIVTRLRYACLKLKYNYKESISINATDENCYFRRSELVCKKFEIQRQMQYDHLAGFTFSSFSSLPPTHFKDSEFLDSFQYLKCRVTWTILLDQRLFLKSVREWRS